MRGIDLRVPQKPPTSPPERETTPRAAIRAALLGVPLTPREISERASVREKDVATHLEHLEKSLKAKGERLVVKPAECLACKLVFRDRHRFTAPGSCPTCQSERIAPPSFRVEPGAAPRPRPPRSQGDDGGDDE